MSIFEKFKFKKRREEEEMPKPKNKTLSLEEIRKKAEIGQKLKLESDKEKELGFSSMPIWKELADANSELYLRLKSKFGDEEKTKDFIKNLKKFAKKELKNSDDSSRSLSNSLSGDIINESIYKKVIQFTYLDRMAGVELEDIYVDRNEREPRNELEADKSLRG